MEPLGDFPPLLIGENEIVPVDRPLSQGQHFVEFHGNRAQVQSQPDDSFQVPVVEPGDRGVGADAVVPDQVSDSLHGGFEASLPPSPLVDFRAGPVQAHNDLVQSLEFPQATGGFPVHHRCVGVQPVTEMVTFHLLEESEKILPQKRFPSAEPEAEDFHLGKIANQPNPDFGVQVRVSGALGKHVAMPAAQVAAPGYRQERFQGSAKVRSSVGIHPRESVGPRRRWSAYRSRTVSIASRRAVSGLTSKISVMDRPISPTVRSPSHRFHRADAVRFRTKGGFSTGSRNGAESVPEGLGSPGKRETPSGP